jgi:hypothetical protein
LGYLRFLFLENFLYIVLQVFELLFVKGFKFFIFFVERFILRCQSRHLFLKRLFLLLAFGLGSDHFLNLLLQLAISLVVILDLFFELLVVSFFFFRELSVLVHLLSELVLQPLRIASLLLEVRLGLLEQSLRVR